MYLQRNTKQTHVSNQIKIMISQKHLNLTKANLYSQGQSWQRCIGSDMPTCAPCLYNLTSSYLAKRLRLSVELITCPPVQYPLNLIPHPIQIWLQALWCTLFYITSFTDIPDKHLSKKFYFTLLTFKWIQKYNSSKQALK